MWALSSNAGQVEESEGEGALALLSHIRNAGVWVQGSRFVAKRYTEILEMGTILKWLAVPLLPPLMQ